MAQAAGNDVDELLAVQQRGEVAVVEHPRRAGQAEGGAADHHRCTGVGRRAGAAVVDAPGAVEEIGEEMAELAIDVVGARR